MLFIACCLCSLMLAPACSAPAAQRIPLSLDTLQVNRCLSIKGAEDILNKPHAFEVSTTDDSMFFIADTDKVCLITPYLLPKGITPDVLRRVHIPATPT